LTIGWGCARFRPLFSEGEKWKFGNLFLFIYIEAEGWEKAELKIYPPNPFCSGATLVLNFFLL
jgi:hypothetical protein